MSEPRVWTLASAAADLRDLAEWFDNPNETPTMVVAVQAPALSVNLTPGYLLRLIADRVEQEIKKR